MSEQMFNIQKPKGSTKENMLSIIEGLRRHPGMYIIDYNYNTLTNYLRGISEGIWLSTGEHFYMDLQVQVHTKMEKLNNVDWARYLLDIKAKGNEGIAIQMFLDHVEEYWRNKK